MKRQAGFTLIELVMVIVIIGILSVVALPKFVDLSADARAASLKSVAGALSSAAAVNYASRKANVALGTAVTNCTGVAAALQGGVMPANGSYTYTITSAVIATDATATCTLSDSGTTALTTTFTAIGIP